MAGITLDQATAKLTEAMAAMEAVLSNQEYRIANRTYRRADLKDIQANVNFWDQKVKSLSRGGVRIIGATPLDV